MELGSDPANCGECGHDCVGATCTGGACDHILLVSDTEGASALTLDATYVYWTANTSGKIKRYPTAGGSPSAEILASGEDHPASITVDGTSVYWGTDGLVTGSSSLKKAPLAGGPPTVAIEPSGFDRIQSVVVDGPTLFWVDWLGNAVYSDGLSDNTQRKSIFGPGGHDVGSSGGPVVVAVDATNVYWLSNFAYSNGTFVGDISRRRRDGTGPVLTTMTAGNSEKNGCGMTMDATSIYWVVCNGKCTGNNGSVRSIPKGAAGNAPSFVELAVNQSGPVAIVVDDSYVYWVNQTTNEIRKAPKVPTGPVGVGVPVTTTGPSPSAIAIDGQALYWTDSLGVWKVRK